jgi:hypothetical protein
MKGAPKRRALSHALIPLNLYFSIKYILPFSLYSSLRPFRLPSSDFSLFYADKKKPYSFGI